METKKYNVVIHYEGSVDYLVEAKDEETARVIAESYFEEANEADILSGIQWDVCDSWEM